MMGSKIKKSESRAMAGESHRTRDQISEGVKEAHRHMKFE